MVMIKFANFLFSKRQNNLIRISNRLISNAASNNQTSIQSAASDKTTPSLEYKQVNTEFIKVFLISTFY
jgi:hypothetical protein